MITPFKKNLIPNTTCVMPQTEEFHTLWFLHVILHYVPCFPLFSFIKNQFLHTYFFPLRILHMDALWVNYTKTKHPLKQWKL